MSMCYERDYCGAVAECDGCYAPAREGDPVPSISCRAEGCDGKMHYLFEGHFDEAGRLVED